MRVWYVVDILWTRFTGFIEYHAETFLWIFAAAMVSGMVFFYAITMR